MKYVIIIPDGAADYPLEELEGQTPLEAARTPNIARLAEIGRQGTVVTTPEDMPCGSDVCSMSLLGYDPARYHRGRAPLEAAALGIELDPRDWIFRVNLVTVLDGKMQDHSAGHISSREGETLIRDFAAQVGLPPGMLLYPGVSYRNILVDTTNRHGPEDGPGRDWSELETVAPHDIPGEPMRKHLPVGGEYAVLLQQLIAESDVFLREHEINLTRKEIGELPATHFWPWGQGQVPVMPSFEDRFKLRGGMITAVDLLAGIAHFIGWDRLDVPGQTSYHDNDYAATGQYAIDALDAYDLLCVHVEAPDEAAHAADAATKVAAIEAIDEHVVGPIHDALASRYGADWRVLLLPDHYTRVETRKHDPTPVPFLMAGKRVRSLVPRPFTEAYASEADLHIPLGHELMEYFLHSGRD
ncbi:MAG: cofactor-independent phosphoglycerate mutase [Phycisphaeraceae bacterium]